MAVHKHTQVEMPISRVHIKLCMDGSKGAGKAVNSSLQSRVSRICVAVWVFQHGTFYLGLYGERDW